MIPKRLGYVSFGHHQDIAGSQVRTAKQALDQSIEIAVGAEKLGFDGAWVRVHHFQRQFASPWALLAAIAARTSEIELGTAVIDMRYENPLQMAELAAAADLISAGRLQLGLSRGSQEPALRGYESFGYSRAPDDDHAEIARVHTRTFRSAIAGDPMAISDPAQTGVSVPLRVEPHSETLQSRIWWGSSTRASARWAGQQGMHLLSSTLLSEDTGMSFSQSQADQIAQFRDSWQSAGHSGTPRVAVVRSVLPIVTADDARLFGSATRYGSKEHTGVLGGAVSRFGKTYSGTPDAIVHDMRKDEAIAAADTVLVTIPNMAGVEVNLRLLATVRKYILPSS